MNKLALPSRRPLVVIAHRPASTAWLRVPVDKQGEGIQQPTAHLLCYTVKRVKGAPKHTPRVGVFVNDQFGPRQIDTSNEDELCIRSLFAP